MVTSTDPIRQGFVASLSRPGGNVTGLTSTSEELGGKILELAKEINPKLSRVGIAIPGAAVDEIFMKETAIPAQQLGVQIIALTVRTSAEYASAVGKAVKERVDAIISRLPPGQTSPAQRRELAELSVKNRLPLFSQNNVDTEAGALLSYGPDRLDQYRRAAVYVDKILKGSKPGDLPVEQPTK